MTDMGIEILNTAITLGQRLLFLGKSCAIAESCTGGRLAAAITDVPGSSQWFDRGFVTYTNEAKIEMLKVPSTILKSAGAVSELTVIEMAKGALLMSRADWSIAVSGIAGPTGGSIEKPVGLVWCAWAKRGREADAESFIFSGDRYSIRTQAVFNSLEGLIRRL